jgi:hypothetical protein
MEFTPSEIEMEKVSALPPFERYQYTIKKVADFEQAYTSSKPIPLFTEMVPRH